jgi:anti-anti-sigma factor
MFVKKVLSRDESLLEVQGALTGETAAEFQQHMQDLVAGGHACITLNLTGVSTINSSTIGKILHFRKLLDDQGRTLQIRGCSEALYRTFQMVNFDKLIKVQMQFTP